MDRSFTRDWIIVILIILVGGILIGSIAKYFRTVGPAYATNAANPCSVQQVFLPTASPVIDLSVEYVIQPIK
jgi:hypothetical protein